MSRLLVVDDDHAFRRSTAALLRADGHEVDVAADASAAVEALRARTYDLVLLDLRMPGMDGWELLTVLQNQSDLRKIPVIVLSERVQVGRPPPVCSACLRHLPRTC